MTFSSEEAKKQYEELAKIQLLLSGDQIPWQLHLTMVEPSWEYLISEFMETPNT